MSTETRPPADASALPAEAVGWSHGSVWITMLVCGLILFVRKPDGLLNPQFWAEDGPVYFNAARVYGIQSLLHPFEHTPYLVQRMVAYLGNGVPVRYAPHFYNYMAFALSLVTFGYIAGSRIPVRHRRWMAIGAVCVPHTGEVFENLTNVHWILALGFLVMILAGDPHTAVGRVSEGFAFVCLCLTGSFVVLFFPLLLIRAAVRRSRYSWILLAIGAGCLLYQVSLFRPREMPSAFNPSDPAWLGFWGNCVAGILLLGRWVTEQFPNSPFMLLLTVALYGWLTAWTVRRRDWLGLAFLWAILASLLSVAYLYRGAPAYATVSPSFRYSFVPFACTVWLLILIVERSATLPRLNLSGFVLLPALVLALLMLLVPSFYPFVPLAFRVWILILLVERSVAVLRMGRLQHRWPLPLEPALALGLLALIGWSATTSFREPLPDLNWAERSRCIGGPEPCVVPINPPPWRIVYIPEGYVLPKPPDLLPPRQGTHP